MTLILLKTNECESAREERGCWRGGLWPRRAAPPARLLSASECFLFGSIGGGERRPNYARTRRARAACFSRALIGPAAADRLCACTLRKAARTRSAPGALCSALCAAITFKRRPLPSRKTRKVRCVCGWCHVPAGASSRNEEISHVTRVSVMIREHNKMDTIIFITPGDWCQIILQLCKFSIIAYDHIWYLFKYYGK